MNRILELHTFKLHPEGIPSIPLYSVPFPSAWKNFLEENRKGYQYDFKLKPMGEKLQSIWPEILNVSFDRKVLAEGKPWLVATQPIDGRILTQMCLTWFQEALRTRQLRELPEEIRHVEWQWQPFQHHMEEPYVFCVVPALFAYDFARQPLLLQGQTQNVELYWHPVHSENHVEFMSQPLFYKEDAYAYVTRIGVVTRGGEGDIYWLNLKTGIRRFITQPLIRGDQCYLKSNIKTSVYVSVDNVFKRSHESEFPTHAYVQLKVERNRNSKNGPKTKWSTVIDRLFWTELLKREAMSSDHILADPQASLGGRNGVQAAVVYSPNYSYVGPRRVEAGAGLLDRKIIFKAFMKRYPQLLPHPELKPVKNKSIRKKKISMTSRRPVLLTDDREIRLEVWTDQPSFYHQAVSQLAQILNKDGVETQDATTFTIPSSYRESKLHVIWCQTNGLTAELDSQLPYAKAKRKRIKEVKQMAIPHLARQSGMALVHIKDYHKMHELQDRDPKNALRTGFLKTGRVTQFVLDLPDGKTLENRLQNSLYDLLADYGFRRENWYSFLDEGTFIGIELLKYKKIFIPVLSYIDGQRTLFKPYGSKKWMPLPEALLSIASSDNPFGLKFENREAFLPFIEREIKHIQQKTEDSVSVLAKAVLRRQRWWPALTNGHIGQGLPFSVTLAQHPKLRFVRLNTTQDVPYYDIIDPTKDDPLTVGSGLFKGAKGLYYSIGLKPDTIQVNKSVSKIDRPYQALRKHQAVELFICGINNEKERDELASQVHELRRTNLTFETHTTYPYPIHILQTFKQYIEAILDIESNYEDENGFEEIN